MPHRVAHNPGAWSGTMQYALVCDVSSQTGLGIVRDLESRTEGSQWGQVGGTSDIFCRGNVHDRLANMPSM